ncbi:MAG TPA: STAS domain-containing protein [Mycobacterium sp.]|jgi:anti-sigma B factor antagonist|nr:STAS domain-containing protein [Mycobacterium sp.]
MPGQDIREFNGLAEPRIGRIVTTDSDAWHASIALSGEIDGAAAPALRREVRRHLRAGRRVIRIDAGAVTFVDSLALGALAAASVRCAGVQGSLILINVPPCVRRIIQLTGLESVLLIDTAPDQTAGI